MKQAWSGRSLWRLVGRRRWSNGFCEGTASVLVLPAIAYLLIAAMLALGAQEAEENVPEVSISPIATEEASQATDVLDEVVAEPTETAVVLVIIPRAPTPTPMPARGAAPSPTVLPTPTRSSTVALLNPGPSGIQAPILMYHYIRAYNEPRDPVGIGLSISPANFDRQMRYLLESGYTVIGMDDLIATLRLGAGLPQKSVVLTFDDGYADFYQDAFPVLKKYGFKATAFVVTDFVGRGGYLSWPMIQELAASGLVSIGSHTVGHVDLAAVSTGVAKWQLEESKRVLEGKLGMQVRLFAYPSGLYNASVMRLVEAAGYTGAVSTRPGATNAPADTYQLRRVRVDGREAWEAFRLPLEGRGAYYGSSAVAPATPTVVPSPTPTAQPTPTQTPRATATPIEVATATAEKPLPTPSAYAIVPNVLGLTETEARKRIENAGLTAGYVNYQRVEDVQPTSREAFLAMPVGSVVSQQPGPGTAVKRGERVLLAVRKG